MNIAKISTLNLSFSDTFNILNSVKYSYLSRGAKATYAALYNWYKTHPNNVHVEKGTNEEFIELVRTEIARLVKVSVKTVISYIKELSKAKLIRDRRMGAKEVNRISFYDVDDKYKYNPKTKPQNSTTGISEQNIVTSETNDETTGLIQQVKDMVMDAFEEKLTNKDVKSILITSDSNINDISEAIKYNVGKPYDNLVAKLCDCIRRRLWTKINVSTGNKKPSAKPPNKNKKPNNGRFTNISSHNWNMTKLERMEIAYSRLSVGEISREEYNKICKEIEESDK